ncbi:MAG: TatD family hydrolase, partial [Patescibacteria group bacterium]
MIDTHAHLNFKDFDNDRDEVIRRSFDNGIEAIIVPGAKLDSSQSAVELAQSNERIFAGIGLHPIHIN